MKKSYLYPILLLIPVLLLSGCGKSAEQAARAEELANTPSQGVLTIDQNDIDLKEIPMSQGTVDATFMFSNTGSEPLVLIKAGTSCMCTVAEITYADGRKSPTIQMPGHGGGPAELSRVLEPGETATLVATFDPNAHGPSATGPMMREVKILTNSASVPEVSFKFRGTVTN